jgi:choline dehydrogenase-like flavoprotein
MSDWIDLEALDSRSTEVVRDVCVVGAGAAGIYAATSLAESGVSTVLLDAGPRRCVDGAAVGIEAIFDAAVYPAATLGRSFGIGGTTSRWGGALVPHSETDAQPQDHPQTWRHVVATVAEHSASVLARLGYPRGPDFDTFATSEIGPLASHLVRNGLRPHCWLHLPVRRKNLVWLLSKKPGAVAGPTTYCNATACSWRLAPGVDGSARIAELTATGRNGNALLIRARHFLLAAGAIESTRILLEISQSAASTPLLGSADLGHFLGDHLSAPIADVAPPDRDATSKVFGPRFCGPWMRGFRFLESTVPADGTRAFAHFIFDNASPGFALAKEVLAAMQSRRMPNVRGQAVAKGFVDACRLVRDRYMHSRLYLPPGTPAHLQLDIEQRPNWGNCVRLDSQRDALGRRRAAINWSITASDEEVFAMTARRLLGRWPTESAGLPRLVPRTLGTTSSKPHDAYHPVGTCRMGGDSAAVVDLGGRIRGMENLWLSSTAALPTAGTANPTFTTLCLAHELCKTLQGTLVG